jgi:hypothetical protein
MRRVVLVITSSPNRRRIEAIVRWVRTLVPAAMLVVSPLNAITLDADALPSGPLSLADALARAANRF